MMTAKRPGSAARPMHGNRVCDQVTLLLYKY